MPTERSIAHEIVSPFDLAADQDPRVMAENAHSIPRGVLVFKRESRGFDPLAQNLRDPGATVYGPENPPVIIERRSVDR